MKLLASALAVLLIATPSYATDIVTIDIAESDEFGQYLTDGAGRPVYIFSTDTPASDDQPALVSCTSADCLAAWPLVTSAGDPEAGEGVDAMLLGTVEHEARLVVTYDGFPLYYFVRDEDGVAPRGDGIESFGGVWSVPDPDATNDAAALAAGETLYAADCAQCHGRRGRGMASFPSVTGREADYISTRLTQYRDGETVGPNSALMMPVAAELSDKDIADLAAFISTVFN